MTFTIPLPPHHRALGIQTAPHAWLVSCGALGYEFEVWAYDAAEAECFTRLRLLGLAELRVGQLGARR